MKKEKFFAVRQFAGREMERVLAEGYRVERGGFAFYICGGGGYSWSATEEKSGMLIGLYGKTRKECIEKLQAFDLSRLEKFDLENLNKEMLSLPLCGL
nr:MAG TPA: hypothetical protein [Caudoviricetes sp.]